MARIKGATPTNQWWSSVVWEKHPQNLFPHPLAMLCHEGEAGRGTPGSLEIGSFENHAALGEAVEVWCFANDFSVATRRASLEVIGNDQEDVFDLCFAPAGGMNRMMEARRERSRSDMIPVSSVKRMICRLQRLTA